MAALAVLIEERSPRRLVLAGALCGLSAWFNQSRGPAGLMGFAIYLLWESYQAKRTWRSLLGQQALLCGSFVGTLVGLSSYFVWKAGLERFLYCSVVFVMKYLPLSYGNGWNAYGADMPSFDHWYSATAPGTWLSIHLLVPLVYLLFFFRAWRERVRHPKEPWDRLMLVSVVGLFLFLGVAPAATQERLTTVSLPALILLVWFAKWSGKLERVVLLLLWVLALGLVAMETRSTQTHSYETLDLPAGRIAFFHPSDVEVFRWFLAHARPSDFLFGDHPGTNFGLRLRNPAQVDFDWVTETDYTRPEQVQNVVETLEAKQVRWVEWVAETEPSGQPGDHLGPLRSYLHTHYHVAKSFYDGEVQVLERNE